VEAGSSEGALKMPSLLFLWLLLLLLLGGSGYPVGVELGGGVLLCNKDNGEE